MFEPSFGVRGARSVLVSIRHADFLLFEPLSFFPSVRDVLGVSIRHADFLLFEPGAGPRGTVGRSPFQSAMRIFCCSNLLEDRPQPGIAIGFNPPCGFFVVRTPPQRGGARPRSRFNPPCGFFVVRTTVCRDGSVIFSVVSIRHADFLLFERRSSAVIWRPPAQFQSAMRIFCCSNAGSGYRHSAPQAVSIRHADFLLFERHWPRASRRCGHVSIRHADFLLFERRSRPRAPPRPRFQSAMRIFCCSNGGGARHPARLRAGFNPPCGFFVVRTAAHSVHGDRRSEFQSAMRIFCCSNAGPVRAEGRQLPGFNPPCGFFVVRTPSSGFVASMWTCFNPPCGFFVVRTLKLVCCVDSHTVVSIRHADFLLFERRSAPAR